MRIFTTVLAALLTAPPAAAFTPTKESEYLLTINWHYLPCYTVEAALMLDEIGTYALMSGLKPTDVAEAWIEQQAEATRQGFEDYQPHQIDSELIDPWEVTTAVNSMLLVGCILDIFRKHEIPFSGHNE